MHNTAVPNDTCPSYKLLSSHKSDVNAGSCILLKKKRYKQENNKRYHKTHSMKTYFMTLLASIMLPAFSWAQNNMLENNRFFKHSACNASGAVEGFGTAAAKPDQNALKAGTIQKYKLDSITALNVWKDKYTYSSDGLFTNMQSWSWDSLTSKWVNKSLNEYKYNTDNLMSEYYFDNWSVGKNKWMTGWKGTYTYNEYKNVTSIVDYKWDTVTNAYLNEWKKEYTYDANQNMTLKEILQWDSTAKVWVNEWKEGYTFNGQNKQMTYSADKWNTVAGAWENIWYENLDYDTNGNALTYIGYSESATDGQKYKGWKEIRAYDEKNNLAQYTGWTWDLNNKNWTVDWKEEYRYDLSNNKINTFGFNYNTAGTAWDTIQKLTYVYDSAIHSDLLLIPYWEAGKWRSKINKSTEYGYYLAENRWVEKANILYSYTAVNVPISAESITDVTEMKIVFIQESKELQLTAPNDATARITTVSGKNAGIYKINGTDKISLSKLSPGSYVITLQSATGSVTEKILIQ